MNARATILAGAFLLSLAALAAADERKFTYSSEAKVLPKGGWEFEQWATLRAHETEGRAWFLDLREEVEYGLADNLAVAGYLNMGIESFNDAPGHDNETEFEFEGVSAEIKYKVFDPATDFVGLLGYAEVGVGEDERELELKIVLSKEFGSFTLAYNFVLEFERVRDGSEWERVSIIGNTFGASFDLGKHWAIGAEARIEIPYEGNFGEREDTEYLVGPNVHYAAETWWATLTFMVQPKELENGEKYHARLIFGFNF